MNKPKRITHKTCPTWGETQCGLERFNTRNHKTTERWRDVTCPKCLAERLRSK
jgi:hypothetical protein